MPREAPRGRTGPAISALCALLTVVPFVTPRAGAQSSGLEARVKELADSTALGRFSFHMAAAFAPQGVYLAPGNSLGRGPAGALAGLGRDTLNAVSRAHWSIVGAGVSANGRDGYVFGFVDVTRPAGQVLSGRFHSYWRRSESGRWEILAFARAPTSSSRIQLGERVPTLRGAPLSPERSDTAALLREVYAAERAFSDSAGLNVARAFGFFAAPGAAKSAREAYVVGPAAIAELFAAPPAGELGPAWTPEWGSVARSGDLAFTLGPAWPRAPGPVQTRPVDIRGRYFTIWLRLPDGTWRWVVD